MDSTSHCIGTMWQILVSYSFWADCCFFYCCYVYLHCPVTWGLRYSAFFACFSTKRSQNWVAKDRDKLLNDCCYQCVTITELNPKCCPVKEIYLSRIIKMELHSPDREKDDSHAQLWLFTITRVLAWHMLDAYQVRWGNCKTVSSLSVFCWHYPPQGSAKSCVY